jgi:uncharacterized protein YjbI with pentapeptide repeats
MRCNVVMARIRRQWSQGKRWAVRHRQVLLGVLGVLAAAGILTFLLEPAAWWIGGSTVRRLKGKDEADAINGVRQTLLQAAAGLVALIVVVFTGMTFILNRRGQVTDRYIKAVGLLASDKLDERIGGIYALEHIMVDSPRDHETVVQVLATFVREHASLVASRGLAPRVDQWMHPLVTAIGGKDPAAQVAPPTDVQTAVTVLGRRPDREERVPLDLRHTDLRGVDMTMAHLERTSLDGAHLEGATLVGTYLTRASLYGAYLQHANLSKAHLEHATLGGARLERTILFDAHLEHAGLGDAHLEGAVIAGAHLDHAWMHSARLEGSTMEGAILEGTRLEGVDLRTVKGLTQTQVATACVDTQTKLPTHITTEEGTGSAVDPNV